MKNHFLILLILFLFTVLGAGAASDEFEIKHADSLEASEEQIDVQGNILIKYNNAIIEAPAGIIKTNRDGKPDKALFSNRAKIRLKDRRIEADKLIVSIQEQIIYAEGNTSSELIDKDKNPIVITSDYQELHWNGENANAHGNVKTIYQDTKITADQANVIYKNKKPYQAVFLGNAKQAYLQQQNHETFANELVFDIDTNNIHAFKEVKSTVWPYKTKTKEEQNPILLSADELFIDHKTGEVTGKGGVNKARLTYEDTKGESNEALLLRDSKNEKPEKIIFKGSADVTQLDKELTSEEVVFSFVDKKLTSNTMTNVRPKTLIFKKD